MKRLLNSLHKILFDEDNADERYEIIHSIISSDLILRNPDLISEFGSLVKDVFGEPDKEPLFDKVVEKALEILDSLSKEKLDSWQKITDLAIDLLLYKSVQSDGLTESENKSMYSLYSALFDTYPTNYEANYWVSIIEGFADCALELGKTTRNIDMLRNSIDLYKQTIELFKTGTFPDYWQLHNMIANTQVALVYAIIEAYQISKSSFAKDFENAGNLLDNAIDTFLTSGTDFNIEYSDKLQRRYEKLKG